MSAETKIEWCDASLSPWEGCTKVSEGCANCYAETRNRRFSEGQNWGKGAPRRLIASFEKNANALNLKARREQRRIRVFPSICDPFDAEVPIEWFEKLLGTILVTPYLDWLLLTKRPQLWRERIEAANWPWDTVRRWRKDGIPPSNLWLGTSVENQQRADERIPELLAIPAKVRFLSCEPLLGAIDLDCYGYDVGPDPCWPEGIDWVIAGGESGPKARPMHPDWVRSLRDQCEAAKVPFFFKQWGEWLHSEQCAAACIAPKKAGRFIGDEVTADGATIGFWNVGKKRAGRLLDGCEWSESPASPFVP